MFCTECKRECETARLNLGPQTAEDHRLRRDEWTEEVYSTCCEAPVSRFNPNSKENHNGKSDG